MSAWEAVGRRPEVLMASDIDRDGIALELTDSDKERGSGRAFEIFWFDSESTFSFSAHRAIDDPLEILSRFIETAVRNLLPTS